MASGLLLVSRMLRAQSECPSLENKKHQGVCVCVSVCVRVGHASRHQGVCVHVHACGGGRVM